MPAEKNMAVGRFLMLYKCSLIFTTFLIGVLGVGLISSGLWIRFDPDFKRYVDETDAFNFLYAGAYVVICIGIVVTVVAIIGCFGAANDNVCIIITFFVAVLLLFSVYLTMIAASVFAVLQRQTLMQLLGDALKDMLSKYYEDAPSKQLITAIQKQFSCCGAEKGISDFVTYTGRKNHPGVCTLELFGQPCNAALVDEIQRNAIITASIAAAVAIVMLIGLIQSMLFCRAVRDVNAHADQNGSAPSCVTVTSTSLRDDIKMADEEYHRSHINHHHKEQDQPQNQCTKQSHRQASRTARESAIDR